MTATHGGKDPTDLFVTPTWAVLAALPHLPRTGVIVDAGCGEGAILATVAQAYDANGASLFLGIETDPIRCEIARARMTGLGLRTPWRIECADFLTGTFDGSDLVIQNPAFSLACPFIARARELTADRHGSVATLLRANWHIPQERAEFVKKHPFDLGWLSKRPAFAASLKCGNRPKCGWERMQRLDDPMPPTCPGCSYIKVTRTTNDSADYGWYLNGPGRGGRMFALDIPAEARARRGKVAA